MNIINALKITLLDNGKVNLFYIFLFLFFAIAFIFFFIELQVLLTPEPDNFYLYLKIWRIKDWLIVGFLSILVSLNFFFFVYLITHTNSTRIKNESGANNKTQINHELTNTNKSRIERISHELTNANNKTRINHELNELNTNKFMKDSLQFEINSRDKIRDKFVYYLTGVLGTLSGIFSAILATALCSSCLAVLFSLLGISFSTAIFFLKYKFLIFIISSILLLISLHFQSKRIIEKCRC
jgi:hypothetical protein